MAAGAAFPEHVAGWTIAGSLSTRPAWELSTALHSTRYHRLELLSAFGVVPVALVAVNADSIVLAVPADMCVWLPASLCTLAHADSGQPAGDGHSTPVVAVRVAIGAHLALQDSTGEGMWSDDPRWPAASALLALA